MTKLPNDVLMMIYSKWYTHYVMPELGVECLRILVLNCIKETPYMKTLSYIVKTTNLSALIVSNILETEAKIMRQFNNIYNIDTYVHIENQI